MSLKYCFQNEIHKTFDFPADYPSLLQDIKSLFVQKLPSQFLIQYQDADGDRIVISTNQEYLMMIAHELPNLQSSIKIFITPLESLPAICKRSTCTPRSSCSNGNGSFEVVEDENSLKVEEIIDDLSVDDESKDNSTSKVVVSLTIPQEANTKDNTSELPRQNESDLEDGSFTCSEAEPKENLSDDSVPEMSFSAERDRSLEVKEENYASSTFYNQAFQTEEENFSFSNESFRKDANDDNDSEDKGTGALRVPRYRENDSKDLSEYLNKITHKKPIEQSFEASSQRVQSSLDYANREMKLKEESQEKWVSFSSEHDDTFTGQATELQRRNFFNLKPRSEALYVCHQDPSYRYPEENEHDIDRNDSNDCEGKNDDFKCVKETINVRDFEDLMIDSSPGERMPIKLGGNNLPQRQGPRGYIHDYRVTFEEERVDEDYKAKGSRDVWYDAYQTNWDRPASPVSEPEIGATNNDTDDLEMNFSNELSCNLDDYLKQNNDRGNLKNVQENVENMNISLLSMSEAKYIASAIGSIHKIRGFKQVVSNDSPAQKQTAVKNTTISPIYNRWTLRKQEIEARDDNPQFSDREEDKNARNDESINTKLSRLENLLRGFASPNEKPDYFTWCDERSPRYRSCQAPSEFEVTPKEILVSNMGSDFSRKDEQEPNTQSYRDFRSDLEFKDFYDSDMSLVKPLNMDVFHELDETPAEYTFEHRELYNTPISTRAGVHEWCVIFKTINLKNTGNVMWTRCQLSPIGLEAGSKAEVTYVAPGDNISVTLEIFGFFKPGKYHSSWQVSHRGEMDIIVDMGYIDLEFEIFEKRGFIDESNAYKSTEEYYEENSELDLY